MGAAFNDEPNYFLRGAIFSALGSASFFGLTWLQNAGIEAIDSSKAAKILFDLRVPYFLGALLSFLGFVSWIRGLMSVAAYMNSCLMTASLGVLVLVTITGVILFFEYRPDLAAKRVAERRASEKEVAQPKSEPVARIFTAADGRTMNATFLGFDGKKVKIQRTDGKVFTNSIGLYSDADQEFFREQSGQVLQPE